jgi:hypothetical protein
VDLVVLPIVVHADYSQPPHFHVQDFHFQKPHSQYFQFHVAPEFRLQIRSFCFVG